MKTFDRIEDIRSFVGEARSAGKVVGFVPTMGGLHEGHFSLIDAARNSCVVVVVSIFVNPTQFGPSEDLANYPRPLETDLAGCEARGVDAVFAPKVETMYPRESVTEVAVPQLAGTLCGRSRPEHFQGVCTVVAKLFNIIPADKAFFGAKDFQQSVIIRRMVEDMNLPVEIIVCPTVRASDGVAVSSRNSYLTPEHRIEAAALYASLKMAEELILASRPSAEEVISAIRGKLAAEAPSGEIDYVEIVDPETLRDVETTRPQVCIALAVKFARARLIDNIVVDSGDAKT